ncbi:collectin-11 [Plakobranchus ocellatus]|uniref:Collectin-11 n=1 Tax=Plakobranchus ocellatus TaxID=259542 RepID=A0AAV4CVN1_9GAST|nr:collectin-11 [Plakobranchus ocellatus]
MSLLPTLLLFCVLIIPLTEGVSYTRRDVLGKTYLVSQTPERFDLATMNTRCKGSGGYLLEINNYKEEEKVMLFLYDMDLLSEIVYTGHTDLGQEGKFYHYDTKKPLSSDIKWRWFEPDNYNGNEHCVNIRNEGINDIECHQTARYIYNDGDNDVDDGDDDGNDEDDDDDDDDDGNDRFENSTEIACKQLAKQGLVLKLRGIWLTWDMDRELAIEALAVVAWWPRAGYSHCNKGSLVGFIRIVTGSLVGFIRIVTGLLVGFIRIVTGSLVGFIRIVTGSLVGFIRIVTGSLVSFIRIATESLMNLLSQNACSVKKKPRRNTF